MNMTSMVLKNKSTYPPGHKNCKSAITAATYYSFAHNSNENLERLEAQMYVPTTRFTAERLSEQRQHAERQTSTINCSIS